MRIQHLAFLASVVFVTTMCGGSGGDTTAPGAGGNNNNGGGNPYGDPGNQPASCTPSQTTVCLTSSNTYNPASVTVAKGTTVTWSNTTGIAHTVTFTSPGVPSDSSSFTSGTKSTTFPNAGTFQYHCLIHGTIMSGTVIVQ